MKTTRLELNRCLACQQEMDAASHMTEDVTPEPDDITICLRCGHVMAFDKDLRFRELTDVEMDLVAGNPEILRIQQARGKIFE